MFTIASFTFSYFSENTYVVYTPGKKAWIIDPGCYQASEKVQLDEFIQSHQLQVENILLTHTHLDHIFGLEHVKNTYKVPIIAHELAPQWIKTAPAAAMYFGVKMDTPPDIDITVKHQDILMLDGEPFKVLYCPGHAEDHVVFYHEAEKKLLAGDVVFYESIGRTDLPGGNHQQLIQSIKNQIFTLPEETEIFPGHGTSTTVGHELRHNPFLK